MTNAMQVYQQTQTLLKSADVRSRFQEILGTNAQAFLASVLSAVYQDDNLQQCDPQSILFAAMKAAILNLPIESNIGQAYIIPYKGKATFQIGYKGIIQLAHRTKEYEIINVTPVYEGEQIKEDRLTGLIILNGNRKSDKIIGYCGYFRLLGGFQKYLYMTEAELDAHGKRYSPSYNSDRSLWKKDPVNMKKKTVLKLLLSKYGPLTVNLKVVLAEDIEPEDDSNTVAGETIPLTQEDKEPELVKKEEPKSEPEPVKQEQPEPPPAYDNPVDPAWTEPVKQPEEPVVPMWQMLVMNGIIAGDIKAKTVMRFYIGSLDWEHVEPWGRKVKSFMDTGDDINVACRKANS